jgi:tRNA threonylcarbamoyl adenosine modification protein YjeE
LDQPSEAREFLSDDEAATEAAGAYVAGVAVPGEVVGLAGELGAGKTVLVRGLVRALGGDPRHVRSPTFTLLNLYRARTPVFHFDLYRLKGAVDLEGIGFYEFTRSEGVAVIEWADRFPEVAAEVDRWVRIDLLPGPDEAPERRRIAVGARRAPRGNNPSE